MIIIKLIKYFFNKKFFLLIFRIREERLSRMVLTVTEDTPADMLAGSMELLVQLPREHHLQMQRVTVQRRYTYLIYSMNSYNIAME